MQTFKDSKSLAKEKDVNNLFGQSTTFKVSGEAKVGNAGEHPARAFPDKSGNNQTDGNNKAIDPKSTAFQQNYFYPNP